MNRGAYWAGSPLRSDDDARESAPESIVLESRNDADEDAGHRPAAATGERVVLGLLALAGAAWIAVMAAVALGAWQASGRVAPIDIVRGVSLGSGPLALIVAILILWQRNGPREAARYGDAARGVRMETLALDAVLGLASRRLAEDRAAVAEQADRLLALADETSAKLAEATTGLGREIAELGRQNRELDAAAGTARVDMGVLLADLPIAEGQVRTLADTLREAGTGAHEQAAALQEALAALAQRAREAEENSAGAASRLSAQVSRIGGAAEVTTADIDTAATRMHATIDAVLARVAQTVERTRDGIAAQGEAIGAMVERTRAAADATAAETAAALEARMAALAREVETLAALLAAQDGVGSALIDRVQRGLGAVEARFAELDETGRARTDRLGEALGTLGQRAERTMASLNDGGTATTTLINRVETLRAGVAACLAELGDALPPALARLEAGAARAHETLATSAPEVERLGAATHAAAASMADAQAALDGRRAGIEALGTAIAERIETVRGAVATLDETVAQADGRAAKLADSTSPKLVEALIRVRETAGQAAERAREALGAIVPHSATALGEAGRKALDAAVGDAVARQIDRMAAASESAVETAHAAAARLETQLTRIAETSASVEARVATGKAEVEASDRDNFSRRTAQLIDALNSTAIDVAKLLSAEPSDGAWAAYLRGDRGVFTRRAVRLLDAGEAREVARHYEADAAFRDQVNRYIHDFEALLRPILATRDGSTLAVILLSSEMGKLYVALAQAIERLRA